MSAHKLAVGYQRSKGWRWFCSCGGYGAWKAAKVNADRGASMHDRATCGRPKGDYFNPRDVAILGGDPSL